MERVLTLAIPAGWRCRGALDHGVLLSAVAPPMGVSGFLPTLRFVVAPVRVATAAWVAEELAELTARLGPLVVEHDASTHLGGRETFHRRVRHLRWGTVALTEQWGWLVGRLGFTLTASAAADEHDALAEVFAAVAASFAVDDPSTAPWPGQSPAGLSSSDVTRAARAARSATA